jgi:transglutaminase-like putative cysteine protease
MVNSLLRRLSVPLVVALLIALAGLSLGRVYNGLLLTGLVAGAAVGSVVVSAALRRVPAWLVAPVSVAALAGYALFAVNTSARAGGVSGDLVTLALDAARNAVPRLLTAMIPVESQPDTVLGPVVLAWLAGFAGAELAARAHRPAVALAPPTLLYAGALVLVGPNADVVAWQPLAFAALAALGLVAGSASSGARALIGIDTKERSALRLRSATGLFAGLITVLAVVAVIAPLVARTVGSRPIDPRRYVQPPNLDVLDQNPLIRISGWAANPDQRLLDVAVVRGAPRATPSAQQQPSALPQGVVAAPTDDPEPGAPAGTGVDAAAYDTRLRLAVLSDWDGVTWHVDADYRNAGRVLPPVAAAPGQGTGDSRPASPLTIEEHITVAELQGRLLPAVSAPQRVDGLRVAYDQSSGTLLNTAPLTPGISYTVTSVNPSIDVTLLPAADVPSGSGVARYLAVGNTVPPDLSRLAERVSTGESSPYLRASALANFLSEHYRFAGDAPSGHAYPNLRFFLFDDPRAGGRRGTSEQFAAAFAALGRLMGLPTRVVVGFRTPAGGGTITGGDAIAWPEVLFSGIGWVAFDPMPQANVPPRPIEDEYLPKAPPSTVPPASVEPPAPSTVSALPSSRSGVAAATGGPGAGIVAGGVAGALVAVLIVGLLAVVLLRLRRQRARLDSGTPPQRVLGAWQEVLDTLVLAGAPPPPYLAAEEIAKHAATVADSVSGRRHTRRPRPAVPPLDGLAGKVNAVGFAGATGAGADDLAAQGAKAQAVGYARALRARRPWWRRLLWRVDPRPLRRTRR